tara:strand:- start:1275 stop:1541 length:267 start_codon:yes stop_codon:yes gene_type:complete
MIKVRVDKIFLGKVSVRDYVYKKALRNKDSLGIEHGKEFMIIPYANLKKARQITDQSFTSKFNGKEYKLIDFDWKPWTAPKTNQERLF